MKEALYGIDGAECVWVNYSEFRSLQKRQMGEIKFKTKRQIKSFLEDGVAVISAPHMQPNEVHDSPIFNGRIINGYRPKSFGRASIVKFGGLVIELKGVGVKSHLRPRNIRHSDGIFHLYNGVYECLMSKLVKTLIKNISWMNTQDPIALIKLPIHSRLRTGIMESVPSCILVREPSERIAASDRATATKQLFAKMTIELVLRTFGVSSTNPYDLLCVDKRLGEFITTNIHRTVSGRLADLIEGVVRKETLALPAYFELINIQLTQSANPREVNLIDLEHYSTHTRFQNHVAAKEAINLDEYLLELALNTSEEFVKHPRTYGTQIAHWFSYAAGEQPELIDEKKRFGLKTPLHYQSLKLEKAKQLTRLIETIETSMNKEINIV